AKLYRAAVKNGARPAGYIFVDIVNAKVKAAKEEMLKTGFYSQAVYGVTGNVFDESFWRKSIWRDLRESGKRVVSYEEGATLNDFPYDIQHAHLNSLNAHFNPHTRINISIDSTGAPQLNPKNMADQRWSLECSYINSDSWEFLFKGFVH